MEQSGELRRVFGMVRRASARRLIIAAASLMALSVGMLAWLLAKMAAEKNLTLPKLLTRVAARTSHHAWVQGGMLVAAIGFLAIAVIGTRRAWLRLEPTGMEAYVPRWLGTGLQGLVSGHVRIPWTSVRSATLECRGSPAGSARFLPAWRIVIVTDEAEYRFAPYLWRDVRGEDHRVNLRQLLSLRVGDARAVIEKTPLVRMLRARGLLSEHADKHARADGFDLARHKGMLIQTVLVVALLIYALADGLALVPYQPVGPLPWTLFVAVAMLGALVVVPLGRGAPKRERLVVGAMALTALTASAYPVALRINAWTGEAHEVIYRASATGRFTPEQAGYPALDLRGMHIDTYWNSYPPGAEHPFTLVKGALGVFELDLRPLHERTRAFYAGRHD